jgi:hypothetical protein
MRVRCVGMVGKLWCVALGGAPSGPRFVRGESEHATTLGLLRVALTRS